LKAYFEDFKLKVVLFFPLWRGIKGEDNKENPPSCPLHFNFMNINRGYKKN
jgi:hypothetical protein